MTICRLWMGCAFSSYSRYFFQEMPSKSFEIRPLFATCTIFSLLFFFPRFVVPPLLQGCTQRFYQKFLLCHTSFLAKGELKPKGDESLWNFFLVCALFSCPQDSFPRSEFFSSHITTPNSRGTGLLGTF